MGNRSVETNLHNTIHKKLVTINDGIRNC